jgi:hypothetical protein
MMCGAGQLVQWACTWLLFLLLFARSTSGLFPGWSLSQHMFNAKHCNNYEMSNCSLPKRAASV